MKSVLNAFVVVACVSQPAEVRPSILVGLVQVNHDASTSLPATNQVDRPTHVALADIVSSPDRYLDKLVTTRGRAGVCPDVCDAIKWMCGSVTPSNGLCSGRVSLVVTNSSETEIRCGDLKHLKRNAIPLDLGDPRFICRGHCGVWSCPAVELNRIYEFTGQVRNTSGSDEPVQHSLVPTEPNSLHLFTEDHSLSSPPTGVAQ